MNEELERVRAQLNALTSGLTSKKTRKARKQLNKQIRELQSSMASDEGQPEPALLFALGDASDLPPFLPPVKQIDCINGPMTPLKWAFTCSVPPLLRPQISSQSLDSLVRPSISPNLQWNNTLFHLAHHYDVGSCKKFTIQDDNKTTAILLEITALRACPDSRGEMGELLQKDFRTPGESNASLGPVPLFFVRFFYNTVATFSGQLRDKAMQPGGAIAEHSHGGGPFVMIRAASAEEVEFAHKALKRGQKFLARRSVASNSNGQFEASVLFPSSVANMTNKDKSHKAPKVCFFCEKRPEGANSLRFCGRCKVTYYCSTDCQRAHWVAGHKVLCRATSEALNDVKSTRPSFTFNALATSMGSNDEEHLNVSVNYRTGRTTANMRSGKKTGMGKIPTTRNIHHDKEFIVKLQPPLVAPPGCPHDWMCYDGPARSFQASVPGNTPGLMEARATLEKEGIWSVHPTFGIPGVKGYFKARWEGSRIRVYYDRLAPPQSW